MRKSAVKNPVVKQAYSVRLFYSGTVLEETGQSILEAMDKIHPDKFKSKGILEVSDGTLVGRMAIVPPFMRRLRENKISREIFQKRIATLMR